ncbi:hypothetical protein DL762_008722 [Monosporascus cannonballus]|uniref:Serine aminopeptidase S33 domain-containing protein n=1 Tax=Monosporascus cannonballus TaxID=155416 RepID=A0ABY0GVB2_9PEZI|nr:hypothetical protein DL762_008722 [Monosporascus cannonballus]
MPPNSRTDVPRPSQFGIRDFEELVIPTTDGEKLSAFYIRGPRRGRHTKCTIVMFHGNAGNIGHRLPIARMLINYVGCNVFMLEYRGYGLSTGEPDEKGLMIDAQTALDYLRDRAETRSHKLVIYGQSLGGAVSIKLVQKNQHAGDIVGLVLENTFLSMRSLIPSVIPPAKYLAMLCHQVWPSESLIPNITEIPILFLSGLQDEIVPPRHMRKLYELATTPTKIWKPLPGGDHNSSVLEEGYFEAISEDISTIVREGTIASVPTTAPELGRKSGAVPTVRPYPSNYLSSSFSLSRDLIRTAPEGVVEYAVRPPGWMRARGRARAETGGRPDVAGERRFSARPVLSFRGSGDKRAIDARPTLDFAALAQPA